MRIKEFLRPYYLRWLYFKLFPEARPSEFSDCWKFASFLMESDELSKQLSLECPPTFLFYPMSDLHARLQRTQHFAIELASRGHACFLLNPHLGRQFSRVYHQDPHPRFNLLRSQLAELHVRLPAEPVYHHRLLETSESAELAEGINPLAAVAGSQVVQILSLPTWFEPAEILRSRFGWPIVYDCHDLISGLHGISRDIIAAEQRLFDAADHVFFSSEHLLKLQTPHNPGLQAKSSILRNAADPSHFGGLAAKGDSHAPDGTVGYFGSLDEWFDVEAMTNCLRRFPDRKFQLIGRIEYAPIRSLARFSNLELTGEVPYAKLPDFVAGFGIGLIPFRVTPLTRATNPIKLYEYFSCGLPVVSSRLPEVELFESLVYLADGPQDFPDCVARALSETGFAKRARRIEAASRETWSERITQLTAALSGVRGDAPGVCRTPVS